MKTFKKILKSKALYIGLSLFIQVIILFLLMTYFGRNLYRFIT